MRYDVEYPERLSRLTTLVRGFLIIPAWLFLFLVMGVVYAGFPAGWTTVFFKKRYPRWLFAANSGAPGFMSRTWAYAPADRPLSEFRYRHEPGHAGIR